MVGTEKTRRFEGLKQENKELEQEQDKGEQGKGRGRRKMEVCFRE